MSTPVQLKITKAGIESVFDAEQRGLRVQLNRIVYSSANFESVNMDTRTQLSNIILESTIAAGGVSEDRQTLRFFSVINSVSELEVKSLGIYTDTNVLFAIASVPAGNLFKVYGGISFIASFGLGISASTSSVINVTTDQNAAMALILMGDHEAALNPHPQYLAAVKRVEQIVDDLKQRLQFIESKPIEEIKVGDLFITTRHFEDGAAVAAHKGYGRWGRFGDGHVLATQATASNNTAPSFFKNLRATGGAYTHKLTINEMPKHNHTTPILLNSDGRAASLENGGPIAADYPSSFAGGDQPHNNVQPSIVIAAWERLPDVEATYSLTADKYTIKDGDTINFVLTTTNLSQGTTIRAVLDRGFFDTIPSDTSQLFVIGSDGRATLSFKIYNVNESDPSQYYLKLPDLGIQEVFTVLPGKVTAPSLGDYVLKVVSYGFNADGSLNKLGVTTHEMDGPVYLALNTSWFEFYPVKRTEVNTDNGQNIVDTIYNGASVKNIANLGYSQPFNFYTLNRANQIPMVTLIVHDFESGSVNFVFKHSVLGDVNVQIGLPGSIVQVKSSSLGTNEQNSGYYIKPSLNLYNLFVSEMGRAPFNNEPITFYIDTNVAIVSRNTNTPAISMGTGWSSQKINIINRGLILGAGGPGGDIGGANGPNGVGGDGGTAIHGSSALIHIMNDGGTIAGGGGGGVSDMYDNEAVNGSYGGGGGGAPFGIGGLSGGGDRGNSASLLTGGAAMFGGTAGGNIGLPGATQTITYDNVPVAGGKAGYVLQGNDRSIITNTNNGKLIGR